MKSVKENDAEFLRQIVVGRRHCSWAERLLQIADELEKSALPDFLLEAAHKHVQVLEERLRACSQNRQTAVEHLEQARKYLVDQEKYFVYACEDHDKAEVELNNLRYFIQQHKAAKDTA